MNRKTKALIAAVITAGVVLEVLLAAMLNPVAFYTAFPMLYSEPDFGSVEETLHLQNLTATRIGEKLNFSLTIAKDSISESVSITEFQINQIPQENIAGLAVYLNGTQMDTTRPLNFALNCGDSVQACLVLPSSSLPPSTSYQTNQASLYVLTIPWASYYKEIALPP